MKKNILCVLIGLFGFIISSSGQNFRTENIKLSGYVTDNKGQTLSGATVKLKNSPRSVVTDANGKFVLVDVPLSGSILVTFVGYKLQEIKVSSMKASPMTIRLDDDESPLNEVQVIAYGTSTRRFNTGDVTKVTADEIAMQPVSDPLQALEGRIPGLLVTQSSGVPGAGLTVQLRGQNSLIQGSDPLFIIDGVPFSPGNAPLNQLQSAAGYGSSINNGMSPFNLISPADIESIDVLKDADATAIYGSRGANGVILITTKKGKAGKTVINANVYSGFSTITRDMPMLNTQQYVEMRLEALKNDDQQVNASTAPDLVLWDTTRYTNFEKLLIGNTAHIANAELSVSGGNDQTQFLIGGGYEHQTTVFPTSLGDGKASVHANVTHSTADKNFSITLNSIYSSDINKLPATDLTGYINTAPNLKLYTSGGGLNWEDGGVPFLYQGLLNANPLAFELQPYSGDFQNLNSNLLISYKVLKGLTLKVSMGYNLVTSNETSLYPSASLDPNLGEQPFSNFANESQKSWIIEPQAEYVTTIGHGKLDILAGNTWQDNTSSGLVVNASNYSSDLLLGSISAAGASQSANTYDEYRYEGLYGRINYSLKNRYIFNLSGRRDGSSRFGPYDRFSDFGAAGAAWIFSEEDIFKKNLPFLSFGKLRASYGITGNDQIGDYKYLDTWTPGNFTYQGNSVLNPTSLYNPNYSWERNTKAELAIDLGFFNDRMLFSMDYFHNRSGNELINYTLPSQTGFSSVLENLDALVQNTGWEFQVNTKNINSKGFTWTSSFNLTTPKNKLLAFPGLATSSYANTFIIGQSLSTRAYYHYLGVNPTTGIYQFQGEDENGNLDNADKTSLKNTDPKLYGGLQNTLSYKNIQLTFFLEFRKQQGYNYLNALGGNVPGYELYNQPAIVSSRWQKPGDVTNIERFTSIPGAAYNAAAEYLVGSDAVISDASFIRLKTLSLSYNLPGAWLQKFHVVSSHIYLQGQNLFTITSYVGSDPETQNIFILPPLKTITAGIQLTL